MRRRLGFCPFLLLIATPLQAAEPEPPRSLAAWAAGPFEVRVALDRPADSKAVASLVDTRIVLGSRVEDEPRGTLRIAAARLVDGDRTLVLSADPHPADTTYDLPLPPSLGGPITYRLRGVELAWGSGADDAPPEWSGWWPGLDSASASHLHASEPPRKAGVLTLRSFVALDRGKITLRARSSSPFELTVGNESSSSKLVDSGQVAVLAVDSDGEPTDLALTAKADGSAPLILSVEADGRPISPDRLTLPWAPPPPSAVAASPAPEWALSGGDPKRGEAVFRGEAAKCATCHKVRGQGGEVGPDLTELTKRDRAWIYRNINEPSTTIHPDYTPYTLILKDGRALVGIVRAEGADAIRVVDTEAKSTTIAKSEIEQLRPSGTSIMPVGLLGPVGEAGVKDLLAYLTGK